jgi:hypothetical protein
MLFRHFFHFHFQYSLKKIGVGEVCINQSYVIYILVILQLS